MNNANHRGFALLEVLVSVLVVSIGVLGLAKFDAALHLRQDVATHRVEARALGAQVLAKVAASADPRIFGAGSDTVAGKSANYARSWSVSVDAIGNSVAAVRVSWVDARGAADHVALTSVFAKDVSYHEAKLLQDPPPLAGGGSSSRNVTPPWIVSGSETPTATSPTPVPPVIVPPTTYPTVVRYTVTGAVTASASAKDIPYTIAASGATCQPAGEQVGSGTYSCSVPSGWSGTVTITTTAAVTPSKQLQFANVTANKTGNFWLSKN